MRTLATLVLLLFGANLASAEEFLGLLTRVEGNKVFLKKFEKGIPKEEITLEAAEKCKAVNGKYNRMQRKVILGGEIEGGLNADIFKKVSEKTPTFAQFKTDGAKLVQIVIIPTPNKKLPAVDIRKKARANKVGMLKKLDGKTITLATPNGELSVTLSDNVKVLKAVPDKMGRIKTSDLDDGLKNPLLAKIGTPIQVFQDENNMGIELHVYIVNIPGAKEQAQVPKTITFGMLKKIDGRNVTVSTPDDGDVTVVLSDKAKILKAVPDRNGKVTTSPLAEGLKNALLSRPGTPIQLYLDAKDIAFELRAFVLPNKK